MITDMFSTKKLDPTVTELLLDYRKVNISLIFIMQSCFSVLNSAHCFNTNIPNKQELQQIAFNHSSDMETWGIFTKNLMQTHILSQLLISLLQSCIYKPDASERIFYKQHKN